MAKSLSILFAASEADPFVKVGGLADVAGSLPSAIQRQTSTNGSEAEIDIRLVIPYHAGIHVPTANLQELLRFEIPYKNTTMPVEVFYTTSGELPVYLISSEWIRNSERVYDLDLKHSAKKYLLFSSAVARLPKMLGWKVDILHANDWHTALSIPFSRKTRAKHPKTIYTIHNLPFMGNETRGLLADFHIRPSKNPHLPVWARELPLPMACATANQVVTVSPTYAQEIMTPEFGCDLDPFFLSIQDKVSGILNGIDQTVWNPITDMYIYSQYDSSSADLRLKNKRFLQDKFGLERNDTIPMLVVISRFDRQKGIDLLFEILPQIVNTPWQAILLGSGDATLEQISQELMHALPERVHTENRFDVALSHQLYAGGDILVMPSRYEPCGLAQMIAMRYGCIPLARATGGLKDSICSYDSDSENATGFLFSDISSNALTQSLKMALQVYRQPAVWQRIQQNAMQADFSWDKSAGMYRNLYDKLAAEI